MSQGQNVTASSVLVLETDPSLRRLISLGLQHHGMHVIEANSLATIPPTAVSAVDLLVLDVDGGVRSNWSLLETVQQYRELSTLPTVVLSWEALSAQNAASSVPIAATTAVSCLAKPFDARALYETIERLLKIKAAKKAALEAQAEERLLARYPAQNAPSIWPFITAAGLLLVVSGMLFQLALAVIGMLIVVVALLLWTLGKKPEATPLAMSVHNQSPSSV